MSNSLRPMDWPASLSCPWILEQEYRVGYHFWLRIFWSGDRTQVLARLQADSFLKKFWLLNFALQCCVSFLSYMCIYILSFLSLPSISPSSPINYFNLHSQGSKLYICQNTLSSWSFYYILKKKFVLFF